MTINQEVTRQELIDALRSGQYRQTKSRLCATPPGITPKEMCCLGVQADLQGRQWVRSDEDSDPDWGYISPSVTTTDRFRAAMPIPSDLPTWMTYGTMGELARINDNSYDHGDRNYANVIAYLEDM